MSDEDHRDSAPLEVAHDAEEQLGLIRVEARGRLVEHQNPRVLFERARDRDELLDGHRIGAERPLDVDVDIEPFQPLASPAARLAPGDQPEPARLAAKRQVLGHRHGRDEIDLLVDCANSQSAGLAGRVDIDWAAVDADFALVAAERAGHDLDERRLACAVLPEQRVHFAGLDPKIDALQRPHAGKRLRDPQHLNSRSQTFRPAVRFRGYDYRRGVALAQACAPGMTNAPRQRTEVVGGARSASRLFPALRQPPGVAAVCRSDGITTHFGSSFLSFRYWVMTG